MNANHTPRPTGGWPDDENRPVFVEPVKDAWWRQLGLSGAVTGTENERATVRAREQVLASLRPDGFVRQTDAGTERLSVDDVVDELKRVEDAAKQHTRAAAEKRADRGWQQVRAALAEADAEPEITDGPWAGFAPGRAAAWCWNLFDYEPHGFVSPGTLVRIEALRLLEGGGLPTVFGYPARAAELERRGLTPETYRRAQEALGKPTFSWDDVRH